MPFLRNNKVTDITPPPEDARAKGSATTPTPLLDENISIAKSDKSKSKSKKSLLGNLLSLLKKKPSKETVDNHKNSFSEGSASPSTSSEKTIAQQEKIENQEDKNVSIAKSEKSKSKKNVPGGFFSRLKKEPSKETVDKHKNSFSEGTTSPSTSAENTAPHDKKVETNTVNRSDRYIKYFNDLINNNDPHILKLTLGKLESETGIISAQRVLLGKIDTPEKHNKSHEMYEEVESLKKLAKNYENRIEQITQSPIPQNTDEKSTTKETVKSDISSKKENPTTETKNTKSPDTKSQKAPLTKKQKRIKRETIKAKKMIDYMYNLNKKERKKLLIGLAMKNEEQERSLDAKIEKFEGILRESERAKELIKELDIKVNTNTEEDEEDEFYAAVSASQNKELASCTASLETSLRDYKEFPRVLIREKDFKSESKNYRYRTANEKTAHDGERVFINTKNTEKAIQTAKNILKDERKARNAILLDNDIERAVSTTKSKQEALAKFKEIRFKE